MALVIGALASVPGVGSGTRYSTGNATGSAARNATLRRPHTTAPAAPDPATGPQAPARGGGGQKVGQTGNPDPGVNFLNVVENPHVRVLQVTLQPGAVRRPHVHNDVTFHMLVPVTGSLELKRGEGSGCDGRARDRPITW